MFFSFVLFPYPLYTQFINGNFAQGSTATLPHTINGWANYYILCAPAPAGFVPNKDAWIDLTGTGYGNGYYIEQSVFTSSKQTYRISFDLVTFFGWDLWDAGVGITINGKVLGSRIWHDSFTYSQQSNNIIYWKRMSSIAFRGTDPVTNSRFTGDSREVHNYGWNRGVGVIAFDNVSLDTGIALSAELTAKPKINVYPNLATDFVYLNTTVSG